MSKKSQVVSGFGFAMQLGATMDEIRRRYGVTEEEFHVLGTPQGLPHLEKMIRGLKSPVKVEWLSEYLRQLYVGETILFDATDGTRTIAQAEDVFQWGIDSDFKNWDLNRRSIATPVIAVSVHEQIKDGIFKNIYGCNYPVLNKFCLTQHQIINFCVKHKDKLRQDGYGTFFLFKQDDDLPADENNLFVADVRVRSGGRLYAYVFHFSHGRGWAAECQRRFVIPQLTL